MPDTASSCQLYNRPRIYPADNGTWALCSQMCTLWTTVKEWKKVKKVKSAVKLEIRQRQKRQHISVFLVLKDIGLLS